MNISATTDRPVFPVIRNSWLLVAGLFLVVTMSAFEVTAVLTALPSIVDELHGETYYGATLAAYLLTSLISVVASGEMADRRGPALPFAIGIGFFITGLIVAGTASSALMVVLGRSLQGLGAGAQTTLTYVVIRRAISEDRQPKVYAIISAGWVLPSLVAPLVSGWITDTFGWKWVFLGLAPLVVVVGALVITQTRHIGAPEMEHTGTRLPEALSLAIGAAAVLAGSTNDHVFVAVPLVGGGLLVCGLAAHRLLPHGTFAIRRGLPAAIAARLAATFAFGSVDSFVPLAARNVHNVSSAAMQGFVIIGAALAWTVGQAVAAKRSATIDTARFVRAGFVFLATGVVLTSTVAFASVPLWTTFFAWMIGGLGMGMLFNPTTTIAMGATTDTDAGLVGGQLSMTDSLGFAAAATLGGTFVAISNRTAFPLRDALLLSFAFAAAACIAGILASKNVR